MDFHVMTLFPDMIMDGLNTSITGRAIKAGVMSVKAYDIREYSNDKHLKVDDYPYGGGAGMVMRAAPVCDCYEDIVRNTAADNETVVHLGEKIGIAAKE